MLAADFYVIKQFKKEKENTIKSELDLSIQTQQ